MAKTLKTRDDFLVWLHDAKPEIEDVLDYLKSLDWWIECLRNGGSGYVKETRDMAYKYIEEKDKEPK